MWRKIKNDLTEIYRGVRATAGLKKGYSGNRPDIIKLIPGNPGTILDVGCGAGVLGKCIKDQWPDCVVTGIDADPGLLETAQRHLDRTVPYNLELHKGALPKMDQRFDVIIFADVLEHLSSPETTLRDACLLLKPGGHVVTSIPNVRHYSTMIALAIFGTWPRRDRGIHDRTHLRFFARKDILHMLEHSGLEPVREHRNLRLIEGLSWTNIPAKILDFWPLRGFFTFQYLHCSRLRPEQRDGGASP